MNVDIKTIQECWSRVDLNDTRYFTRVAMEWWCDSTFASDEGRYYFTSYIVFFKNESDKTWFLLQWGDNIKCS